MLQPLCNLGEWSVESARPIRSLVIGSQWTRVVPAMVMNGSLLWREGKGGESLLGSIQSLPAISYLSRFPSFCCVQTGRGFYCVLFHFTGLTHAPLHLAPPSGVSFQCVLTLVWKWKSGRFRLYQRGSNSCCCFVGVLSKSLCLHVL